MGALRQQLDVVLTMSGTGNKRAKGSSPNGPTLSGGKDPIDGVAQRIAELVRSKGASADLKLVQGMLAEQMPVETKDQGSYLAKVTAVVSQKAGRTYRHVVKNLVSMASRMQKDFTPETVVEDLMSATDAYVDALVRALETKMGKSLGQWTLDTQFCEEAAKGIEAFLTGLLKKVWPA